MFVTQGATDSGQVAPPDGNAGKEAEDSSRLQRSAEHVSRDREYRRRDERNGSRFFIDGFQQ